MARKCAVRSSVYACCFPGNHTHSSTTVWAATTADGTNDPFSTALVVHINESWEERSVVQDAIWALPVHFKTHSTPEGHPGFCLRERLPAQRKIMACRGCAMFGGPSPNRRMGWFPSNKLSKLLLQARLGLWCQTAEISEKPSHSIESCPSTQEVGSGAKKRQKAEIRSEFRGIPAVLQMRDCTNMGERVRRGA
ncbi:hypothetical protein JZ751_007890 [Albula glossodonta]|uniref:Uncharacterized protein n=1 Tax=Albula glossodonta TaxID=121402 RepID=A0A8T2P8Y4_9TELE|nr:hypothetical protein JZ751_007890 [Albula glossodonta]